MEKYIRNKWEKRAFMEKATLVKETVLNLKGMSSPVLFIF